MSREIEIRKWCDGCAAEIADSDGAVEPATTELLLEGLRLDLCERHVKALWQPLLEVLQAYGAKPDDPPSVARGAVKRRPLTSLSSYSHGAPGPWVCLCGHESDTARETAVHLRERHKARDLSAAFGMRCPLDGKTVKLLGPHVTRAHPELANQSLAFTEASKLGDPHKVVAKQRRSLGK